MYTIFADDTLIYDSSDEEYKIGKGSGTLETSKAGSFVFSVYPDHPYYNQFVRKRTVIVVKKSGKILFRGRVLDDKVNMQKMREITCEGELNFLQDSIIRPYTFTGTPAEAFAQFVNGHNAQVDAVKQFRIGRVTVFDANDYIARSNSNYENTLQNLTSRLLEDSTGGYLHITHDDDGTDPIPTLHYLSDFTDISSQTIEFGANLTDYLKQTSGQDIATAIIPLGAKLVDTNSDTEDPRLTIADVNDGMDYVYDEDAVAKYGWIFDTVIYDDVTLPNNLKTKALADLASRIRENVTLTLSAVDLHLLDRSVESFRHDSYIRVISIPHNFAETLLCNKQTFDLLRPQNDTVTLGNTSSTLTSITAKTSSAVSSQTSVQQEVTNLSKKTAGYKIAEQRLTNLMAQSFGVFRSESVLEDGSTVYYMHDKPTLDGSTNIWKMTGDVFAVSSDGGQTWSAGMDAEGNAILNVLSAIGIQASWINAENLTAISANLGGWEIREDEIYKEIADADDPDIVSRIHIRAPLSNTMENALSQRVIEVETSKDGGETFLNSFCVFGDGNIRVGNPDSDTYGSTISTRTGMLQIELPNYGYAGYAWNGMGIYNYNSALPIAYIQRKNVTGGETELFASSVRSGDGKSVNLSLQFSSGTIHLTFTQGILTDAYYG